MNREIKFRAWDTEDQRMIVHEQDFIPLKVCSLGVLRLDPHSVENKWIIIDANRTKLMQWTGLKDKNGIEIYEGDIVKFHDHPTGTEDGIGEVYWKYGMWKLTWSIVPLGDYGTAWTEIIGNIYETPELINQTENA